LFRLSDPLAVNRIFGTAKINDVIMCADEFFNIC